MPNSSYEGQHLPVPSDLQIFHADVLEQVIVLSGTQSTRCSLVFLTIHFNCKKKKLITEWSAVKMDSCSLIQHPPFQWKQNETNQSKHQHICNL